jgi:membrane protein YqaA with SNARE-associated domain
MTLLTLWATTFAVCVVGAIIPVVNTEIYLIAVSAMAPPEYVMPLVIAATVGQMVGKVAMYYAGMGVLRIRSGKIRDRVHALRERMESRPWLAKGVLFSSATVGLPPLYAVTLACGALGMGIFSFLVIGSVGRLIHFTVVALLPQYAKLLIG